MVCEFGEDGFRWVFGGFSAIYRWGSDGTQFLAQECTEGVLFNVGFLSCEVTFELLYENSFRLSGVFLSLSVQQSICKSTPLGKTK